MTILVRIASYRDPELLPTLYDCIEKAKWPNDLRFALCWQHDEAESLDAFGEDPRFRIIDVPHMESQGATWARALCADRYEGETFTMGLDSHHRFAENWDETLLQMMEQVPSSKPILTTYPPDYRPDNSAPRSDVPCLMRFVGFTDAGTITMSPQPMHNYQELDGPIPSRFYAGGFSFAQGVFLEDVPPDPEIYFRGEEANTAVRAYTHGYDLFHPHRTVCWHEYLRDGKARHWDDHKVELGAETSWLDLHQVGISRFRRMFGHEPPDPEEDFGKFGFGSARTFRDYEVFAGIHFARQGVQIPTLEGKPPPSPYPYRREEDWLSTFLFARTMHVVAREPMARQLRDAPETWVIQIGLLDRTVLLERPLLGEDLVHTNDDGDTYLSIHYISPEPAEAWVIRSLKAPEFRVLLTGTVERAD